MQFGVQRAEASRPACIHGLRGCDRTSFWHANRRANYGCLSGRMLRRFHEPVSSWNCLASAVDERRKVISVSCASGVVGSGGWNGRHLFVSCCRSGGDFRKLARGSERCESPSANEFQQDEPGAEGRLLKEEQGYVLNELLIKLMRKGVLSEEEGEDMLRKLHH